MPTTDSQTIRPITPTFQTVIEEHAANGMRIVPIDNYGTPQQLKSMLGLQPEDFTVCAFMASGEPINMPGIADLAQFLPAKLAAINNAYDLQIRLLSGGGNWKEGPKSTGLMARWAQGATANDNHAFFVTMQELTETEGLPYANGTAVCLKQNPGEDRIGKRADGLICAGDLFIVFPGGWGTDSELTTLSTNISIRSQVPRKIIMIDPVATSPRTGEINRYWDSQFKRSMWQNDLGTVSDGSMKGFNDNCLVYQPKPGLSGKQMCKELVTLVLAIREAAYIFDPKSCYAPLHPNVRKKYIIPFVNGGSQIKQPFDHYPANHGWLCNLHQQVDVQHHTPALNLG